MYWMIVRSSFGYKLWKLCTAWQAVIAWNCKRNIFTRYLWFFKTWTDFSVIFLFFFVFSSHIIMYILLLVYIGVLILKDDIVTWLIYPYLVVQFLGPLVDKNLSIRCATRKILKLLKLSVLKLFTLTKDALLDNLARYPEVKFCPPCYFFSVQTYIMYVFPSIARRCYGTETLLLRYILLLLLQLFSILYHGFHRSLYAY